VEQPSSNHPSSRIEWLLWGVIGFAVVVRFVGLEFTPPGFSMDEAIGAANLACLGETGRSADNVAWPLFAIGDGGGFYTPVYLYFGAAWTRLFGISIGSIRSIPAVFVSITLLGVYLLGRRLGGSRAGFWALLLASLSPWGFHFSRVAWDPPLAPAFLVWCCFFWTLTRPVLGGALSGVAFTLAIYSYPPARLQAPLVFAALFFITWQTTRKRLVRSLSFAIGSVPLAIPLIRRMLDPNFAGRGNSLAIFTPGYLKAHRGFWSSEFYFVRNLADNIAEHLRPSFLFLTGDANLRHASQYMGELGLVDDLALLLGLGLLVVAVRGDRCRPAEAGGNPPLGRLFLLGGSGFFLGGLACRIDQGRFAARTARHWCVALRVTHWGRDPGQSRTAVARHPRARRCNGIATHWDLRILLRLRVPEGCR
jgi:4-amino-4-deoxy-L-arabinose transferase-like glycosyltransferase